MEAGAMLDNLLGGAVGEVAGVRWALPVRTPSDKQSQNNMGVLVASAQGQMIATSLFSFPKIAHTYLVEAGEQADPEAAPVPTFAPAEDGKTSFPLDDGYALSFDARAGTIAVERGGESMPIWGQSGGDAQFFESSSATLANGARITIATMPSATHGDALIPASISIDQPSGTTTLRAAS
jgi:hypothetical protein